MLFAIQKNKLKIERNVPIPPRLFPARKGRFATAAQKMEIGDSVLLPSKKDARSLRASLIKQGFSVVLRPENGQIRCWKVDARTAKWATPPAFTRT